MKKNSAFLICISIFSLNLFSQDFTYGIKAGVNISKFNPYVETFDSEFSEGETNKSSNSYQYGLTAGIYTNIPLNEKLTLQGELLFSQLGNENTNSLKYTEPDFDDDLNYIGDEEYESKTITNTKLNVFSLPISIQYQIYEGLYVYAGPQINFLFDGKVTTKYNELINKELQTDTGFEDEDEATHNSFKELDIAFNFGLGYKTNFGLTLDARYSLGGVTRLFNNNDGFSFENFETKARNIQITLGYDIFDPYK